MSEGHILVPENALVFALDTLISWHDYARDDRTPDGALTGKPLSIDKQQRVDRAYEAIVSLSAARRAVGASPISELATRVLAMARQRNWDLHWSTRGVYLHLEVSELIEAARGKGTATVESEASDVLLALMLLTETQGIPFMNVVAGVLSKCAELEGKPPYQGEDSLSTRAGADTPPLPLSILQLLPGELTRLDGKPYFRYDFDSCDSRAQWDILCDTQEMLQERGWQIANPNLEHDCLTGFLIPWVATPPEGVSQAEADAAWRRGQQGREQHEQE